MAVECNLEHWQCKTLNNLFTKGTWPDPFAIEYLGLDEDEVLVSQDYDALALMLRRQSRVGLLSTSRTSGAIYVSPSGLIRVRSYRNRDGRECDDYRSNDMSRRKRFSAAP